MHTWIYKGNRKAQTYLYITQKDDFSAVPDALLSILGELQFVVDVELDADRKLALADINEVRAKLTEQQFYLQMPPGEIQKDIL